MEDYQENSLKEFFISFFARVKANFKGFSNNPLFLSLFYILSLMGILLSPLFVIWLAFDVLHSLFLVLLSISIFDYFKAKDKEEKPVKKRNRKSTKTIEEKGKEPNKEAEKVTASIP